MSHNKLHLEKSLYLKQHAENPIHWWPYSADALEIAKREGKLIFLSIGYSSCHWCHVMAHESFEDAKVAESLNSNFISIKVDREEYPDLDHYYQNASALMNGRGGWPLNLFLTPEGKVFFSGTYFPNETRGEMPSFLELTQHILDAYKNDPKAINQNAQKIEEELRKNIQVEKKIEFKGHFPPPSAVMNALKNYGDQKNGGYGKAPKFPHYSFYEWGCEQILEGMIPKELGQHLVETIEKMMMGGMYDHLKGGIHRYSTDDKFMVPHFEKMLYDQAGLLKVLSKLSQFYPSPLIFDGILQTIDYLKTEMIADESYFFSAQDADSEGVEGLYFTFSKEEFVSVFEDAPDSLKTNLEKYLDIFNISELGNFEHGLNVISLNPTLKEQYYSQEGWDTIREIRRRLLEQRKLRIPPATDRKGVAGWNYMLLSALADVVQYCPIEVMKNEALGLIQHTVGGCLTQFLTKDSHGLHQIKHTNSLEKTAQYLEDYVQFANAQLRLYEVTGNHTFKKNALETTEYIINHFMHEHRLYETAKGHSSPGNVNIQAAFHDQSYQSSTMTFVLLISRLSLFDSKFSPENVFKNEYKELAHFVLTNPIGHGEGLRALTYPLDIFRKVEVPLKWLENLEFIEMRSHFFTRFIIDYQNIDEESYQICTKSSCEVSGKGFKNFQALFNVKENPDA